MDWQIAITRNREALLTIVNALMASLGLVKGGVLTTLPFHLYRKALLIIRPAEAALRRLIVIAAYDLRQRGFNLSPPESPPAACRLKAGQEFGEMSAKPTERGSFNFLARDNRTSESQCRGSFLLIEPLKSFNIEPPDFSSFGTFTDNPMTTARIPATALGRRLLALHNALNSISKQARRLIRWYAVRDVALKRKTPHRLSPMRPGLPPGYQRRPRQEIESILMECHGLAHDALERRDSS